MNVVNTRSAPLLAPAPAAPPRTTITGDDNASIALPGTDAATDSVEISGEGLMQSRLFPGTSGPGANSVYKFLTGSDRAMLSSLYTTASEAGGDLHQVDALAFDLANYRSSPAGLDKVGTTFDASGNPIIYAFSPADEAAAQRILTSKAMSDTAIPTDFLRHLLDPGLAAGDHAVDFDALEKMVYANSTNGSDGAADPGAKLAPRPAERLAAMKAAGVLPDPAALRHPDADGASLQKSAFIPSQSASRDGELVSLLLQPHGREPGTASQRQDALDGGPRHRGEPNQPPAPIPETRTLSSAKPIPARSFDPYAVLWVTNNSTSSAHEVTL